MSARRVVPIAVGSVLLACVMAIAVASIALHPTEEEAQPQSPLAAQLDLLEQIQKLPRPAEMIGRIRSVDDASLTVSTQDGPHTLAMDESTRVIRPDGTPGVRSDLKPGMDVAIVGEPRDGARSLRAEVVAILPTRR